MTSSSEFPVMYSFRRCPYAMRARMVTYYSETKVELRDILLKDKPASMITASPKATVPVLVLPEGEVLEESLDIIHWAMEQNDPKGLAPVSEETRKLAEALIEENDGSFKTALDKYKYHVRFPEESREDYRGQGEDFLQKLENLLSENKYLLGDEPCVADVAIFPFIRQFANSDRNWFDSAPFPNLQKWLNNWIESDAFSHIMKKREIWREDAAPKYFPDLA